MSDLVKKLSQGEHTVEVSLRPEATPKALQESIAKGYVHLKFPNTQGGTDLYVPLLEKLTDTKGSDFGNGLGTIKLVGQLTLDYVPVRCVATIDLQTMAGVGHLEPMAS
jgi:hypothetical protein